MPSKNLRSSSFINFQLWFFYPRKSMWTTGKERSWKLHLLNIHRKPDTMFSTLHTCFICPQNKWFCCCCSVTDSWQSHRLQHARLPCYSPSPEACLNSCPLSWWCHPTISPSVIPFSYCLQSFPRSGSFPMSQFFMSGGQVLELQLQHQSFQGIFRTDFL